MRTAYKLFLTLALTFASVIAPSLTGRAGAGSASLHAQTIGEAFYIYRNDGSFNAFFREEVDSMAYSCYDLDSLLHDDVVTQVVFTQDSTYRIPLEAIDSVSFVQPETVYKLDVMRMDEAWLSYVVAVGDNTITFLSDTPSDFLPVVGQVIVAETFEAPFELGFSGRVIQIETTSDGIVCTVEEVSLSDIYEHIVSVGVSASYGEGEVKGDGPHRIWGMNTDKGARFPIPHLDVDIGPFSISCDPSVVMKYIVCVGERNLKDYVSVQVYTTLDGSVSMQVKRDGDYHPEPIWKINVPVNTSIPGLYGRVRAGGFVRASGSVNISATLPFVVNGYSSFVKAEGKHSVRENIWTMERRNPEAEISLDGTVSTGVAVQLQFGIIHEKVASADITAYVGPQLSAHFSLSAEGLVDRTLYSSLKNSEVSLDFGAEIVPGYRFWGSDEHHEVPVSLNLGYNINKWYVVPEFSDLSWTKDEGGASGTLAASVSRDLLPKVTLGWGLYDSDDNLYDSYYFPQTYRKLEDWNNDGLSYHLADIPSGSRYTAYPLMKLMGCEMRSNEGIEIAADPKVETGEVTDVTGSGAICYGHVEGLEYGTVVDAGICYATELESQEWQYTSANQREDGDFSVSLTGLHGNTTYYYCAYAYVDGGFYYGDDILQFTTSFPVTLSDFRVTKSQHKEDGFTNDGLTYDYRFDVSVTATLDVDDLSQIADWGYVYEDPNGRKKELSLAQFGTSYTDTRYAYFRNEAYSTARLYGYVRYVGSNEAVYGEPEDFPLEAKGETTCPDANHPHMIDLGLPSGTKWACCNIGAHAPEQYGGFYAWGETQTKSIYNADTYIFDNQDIGSDISQGDYDVAFSLWGNDFAMPTQAQVTELLNECEYEWGVYNGIQGAYFTGSNGKKIFLPADGNRWDGDSHWNVEFGGYYWTSTQNPNRSWHAYGLNFTSASAIINSNDRSSGQMVRPIMKKKETTCPDANHPHMIDLGIGTLWACCNVGASAPEQYGNYYAWGETQPKNVYNFDTYKYGSDWDELTRYCTESSHGTVDNRTVLEASDDAATVNWGAPWRMPTLAECQDLLNKCISEWTTVNGVRGRKFTGPNGGTIFLPAAGGRWFGELDDTGSNGGCWSSTLDESYPDYAGGLRFGSGFADWYYNRRDIGDTVRPVR